ncbi:MAG: SDR family oxidoreductase [Gammaproteobacteria bacterium]
MPGISDNHYHTALVTGASSGIGAETVRSLSAAGLDVHAVARRGSRLEALAAETGCTAHVLDVRDTDAVYELLTPLSCDVLVNNAGLGRGFETLQSATREDIDRTLSTNVTAAFHVTRAVLPGMVERKRGHVVNIGSTAGLYPVGPSIYGASKGAIHLMCRNMRIELAGTGIRVTEICPGRVVTEFFDVALDDEHEAKSKLDVGAALLEPGDIAEAVVYAVRAPQRVNVNMIEIQPTAQHYGGAQITPQA